MSNSLLPAWKLREARRCLHSGGVIAYPTEAVYGLGCDPLDPQAVARLFWLKGRAPEKGVILVASAIEQLAPYIRVDEKTTRELEKSWPGPVTWVVPAATDVPAWITGGRDTVAVRVTAHPIASDLCTAFGGALVSTSANTSGKEPARNPLQVRQRLRHLPDMIVYGATGKLDRPTEIRDAASGILLRA
ncbi:L-threonylcarbamoyladenylate synthase [Solemya velum gill symbiont]|uniref:L-threonylcarbamoyladenylate synthase n=1 Tax=Solemya velum gill symbiont TaxID=2340 RepID=UPI0015C3D686|nr:L-threonylcarbamoyladenylate synthase [Solemya velum gill symbiont]